MKALLFKQKGAAEKVLTLEDINIPDLPLSDVKVKILASPINPADFMFIEKTYRINPVYPQIAGFEGAGLIADNGGDHRFPINSLVAFRHKNVWAEYVNIPKNKIIPLPQNMPVEKTAQLALNPLTAWALLEESNAQENEWIILSAGNSAVSKLIIQFARNRGIKTIPIVRDIQQKEALLRLGANLVLTADSEEIIEQIQELAKTVKISSFLDAVGGTLTSTIIKAIPPNSKIIQYGLYSDQPVVYQSSDVIFKNLTIQGFGIDAWSNGKTETEIDNIWKAVIREVLNHDFKMEVAGKYPLSDFKKALSESRKSENGKILFWLE